MPKWPDVVRGRENLIAVYSAYGNNIALEKGDGLAVHYDRERGVRVPNPPALLRRPKRGLVEKVKGLSPKHRFLIAIHSLSGVVETGLRVGLAEKKA